MKIFEKIVPSNHILFIQRVIPFIIISTVAEKYFFMPKVMIIPLIAVCLLALTSQRVASSKLFWLFVSIWFFSLVCIRYNFISNHIFVMCAMCAHLFVCGMDSENKNTHIVKGFKFIFIIILFFAALRKLISPTYINGSFMAWMILKGRYLRQFISDATVHHNLNLIDGFTKWDPLLAPSTLLQAPFSIESFMLVCIAVSVSIILIEFIVPGLFLIKKLQNLRHYAAQIFLTYIAFVFVEFNFAASLAILGLSQIQTQQKRAFLIYIGMIVVFGAAEILLALR